MVGLVLVAALLWSVAHLLLLIFAACLVAIFLDALTRLVGEWLRLPRWAALTAVLGALCLLVGSFAALGGPQLTSQVAQLGERLPRAAAQLETSVRATHWGRALLRELPPVPEMVRSSGGLAASVPDVFSSLMGATSSVIFVLLIGLYAALDPALYVRGALHLLPKSQRWRAEEVLAAMGHAMRWWLLGRLVTMTAIGLLTGVGLALIDLPLAAALGAIAGIFSFVPFVGPIAAAIPALLVGLAEGPLEAFWVATVYVLVQFLEGNVITPFVQQRAVSLPPAVLLTAQLAMWFLFGVMGLLVATPLTVLLMVMVQVLYVRHVLGEPVAVLGQHPG